MPLLVATQPQFFTMAVKVPAIIAEAQARHVKIGVLLAWEDELLRTEEGQSPQEQLTFVVTAEVVVRPIPTTFASTFLCLFLAKQAISDLYNKITRQIILNFAQIFLLP